MSTPIESGLRAIAAPGSIFEVRAVKVRRNGSAYASTWSGYFDDPHAAARGIAEIDGKAVGVYMTMNSTKPELLARAVNRIREVRGEPTTSDDDVTRRTRLLVDLDPVRVSGISSTDDEHAAALARCAEIMRVLAGMGAPAPVFQDSGNGGQLIYAIDLPADDGGLVKRVLAGLAHRFDDAAVYVDQTNFNPARIVKVPGTLTRKGDHTPERPHRRSAIVSKPETLDPIPAEILETIAAWAPPDKPKLAAVPRNGETIDLEAWLARNGIEVKRRRPWLGGAAFAILCPADAAHGFDAWAGQDATGMLSAACFHRTCSFKSWRDLRDRFEPRASRETTPISPAPNPEEPPWLADDQDAGLATFKTRPKLADDHPASNDELPPEALVTMAAVVAKMPSYAAGSIVRDVGLHLWWSRPGNLKTYLAILLVLEMTQRGPGALLFGVPGLVIVRPWRRVLWLGDEETAEEWKARAEAVARGHGLHPPGDEVVFADASGGPRLLNLDHVPRLLDLAGPDVSAVFADPLANLGPDRDAAGRPVKVDLDNPHALHRVCRPLRRLAKQREIGVFLLHHANSTGERERGPTAYRGSSDVVAELKYDSDVLTLIDSKNRDRQKGRFSFRPVWADTPAGLSVRFEIADEPVATAARGLKGAAKAMYAAAQAGAGHLTHAELMRTKIPGDKTEDVSTRTKGRAWSELVARRLVCEDGGVVRLLSQTNRTDDDSDADEPVATCETCGAEIESLARFCGSACRQRAYRARVTARVTTATSVTAGVTATGEPPRYGSDTLGHEADTAPTEKD